MSARREDPRTTWDGRTGTLAAILLALLSLLAISARAQEAICARVRLEIKQELTIERQAFEAEMQITNALDTNPMSEVTIDVLFSDENGNPVRATSDANDTSGKALFFLRTAALEGIQNVTGAGSIAPGASAKIRWLIIPAAGSGGASSTGKLYLVGAVLGYKLGADPKTIEVAPDSIYVKPLPKLALDYFLTNEVYADDPFTPAIEPPEPFTLGVRVKNNGTVAARNLKIESAQPKITENTQGLLINFRLTGSYVNDQATTNSLLIGFGDVPAQRASMGRWVMITTLSGKFVDFNATFTHADELGGSVTSLLERASAHLLVRDVKVDLPGRDAIRDFLARDGDALRVYESDSRDSPVSDQSGMASLAQGATQGADTAFQLNAPPTQGFFYAKLRDPFSGQKAVGTVVRADGKTMAPENVWLSKTRNGSNQWEYFVNFFDVNTPGRYNLVMSPRPGGPQPPVLQFIGDRSVREGQRVSFVVEASDPNGDSVKLSASALPAGAKFTDAGTGQAVFDWTPSIGQAGRYAIVFEASDGSLKSSQPAAITVQPAQLPAGPALPALVGPLPETQVRALRPILAVRSIDALDSATKYFFEVYGDESLSTLIAQGDAAKGTDTTTWKLPQDLADNTRYLWRVRAFDGRTYSEWVTARFFVNTVNDAPSAPVPSHPRPDTEVDTLQPTLSVGNSTDADGDPLTYGFEVFSDSRGSQRVASVKDVLAGPAGVTSWQVPVALDASREYWWRANAVDPRGALSETRLFRFVVDPRNRAPGAPGIGQPQAGAVVRTLSATLTVTPATDPDGNLLTYSFELDRTSAFNSPAKRTSVPISAGASGAAWSVSNLSDNTRYFWRARASDGRAEGPWVTGDFLVSPADEAPAAPVVRNLAAGSWTEATRPRLEVAPAIDPEGGPVSYRFQVFGDAALQMLVAEGPSSTPEWLPSADLGDGQIYYWRAAARDSAGNQGPFSAVSSFLVSRAAPQLVLALNAPAEIVQPEQGKVRIAWEVRDPLNSTKLALYFDRDDSGEDGTLIVENLAQDPTRRSSEYLWDASALAPGTYYIYAVARNGERVVSRYAPGALVVPSPAPKGSVVVRPTSAQQTAENGAVATLQVWLASEPAAEVLVPVHSTRPDEAATRPSALSFTPANWSTPQSITVTGVNDCGADGDQAYRIIIGRAESRDVNYAGVFGGELPYINLDDDSPSSNPIFATCNIRVVSSRRVTTLEFEYQMVLDVTNSGPGVSGLAGTMSSNATATKIVEGQVVFGPIPAGGTATSQDTFTIRQDRRFPFDPSALRWTFQPLP